MKNLRWTILAALILAAPCAVQAQTAPATDAGAVTNAPAPAASTAGAGIPAEGTAEVGTTTDVMEDVTTTEQTTRMVNTGGEPILMSLLGMSVAMGAFFLRRRVTG